jgi:hypothetical protein
MATRENQGLQFSMIAFAILAIGLFVGLIFVNNARKTQKARADQAEASAKTARDQASQAQGDSTQFKEFMGFGEPDNLESIRTAFDADMVKWAPNMPAESRQYRIVLGNFFEENRKLVGNAAAAADEVKQLKDRLLAVEAQKEEQVKQFQEQMKKVSADAAAEHTKFEDQYARIKADNDGIQKQMDELRTAHDEAIKTLEDQKTQLKNQISKLEGSIDKLRKGVPNPDQFAQPADGRITWINQRYGTVWVDLGSADGLRPQVTFAVAQAGLQDAAEAEQKGSIEITRILGPHMAEARVTKDDSKDPLVPGDRIFSQVWDRGRQVGIGIAGFIDIDKDGKSDLDKLKAIVAASGGVVDAGPDKAGKNEGELKVSTRYLVLGEYPNDARLAELGKSWNDLSEQATKLGVETVSLDEFLSLIGWRRETRSVPMGPGARAEDFPPEPAGQEMPRRTGQPGGAFKKRMPHTTY